MSVEGEKAGDHWRSRDATLTISGVSLWKWGTLTFCTPGYMLEIDGGHVSGGRESWQALLGLEGPNSAQDWAPQALDLPDQGGRRVWAAAARAANTLLS